MHSVQNEYAAPRMGSPSDSLLDDWAGPGSPPLERYDVLRDEIITAEDYERMDRGTATQGTQWTCGYTGHVPFLRSTFATRTVVAAKKLKPDLGQIIAENDSRPQSPESPVRHQSPQSRPGTQHSTRSVLSSTGPRVESVCGGQRRLVASATLKYPGNGFCGTLLPSRRTDRVSRLQVYEQGTKVNLSSYYATCEANNYQVSHIQSGFAGKNKSSIYNGDHYYFSGKHMYDSTQVEAYRPSSELTGPKAAKLSYEEEDQLVKDRLRKYAVARAVVGKARITEISTRIGEALEIRVAGGAGFRRRMFAIFDKNGSASVTPSEFRLVCRDLGIIMTEIEAVAVYGAADVNGDGSMSFHEFLAQYMGEVSALGQKNGKQNQHQAKPDSPA